MKHLYQVLGVKSDSASQDEIKKQYRKLSMIYHPDKYKDGSDQKFKDINNAYAILSDPAKWKEYDNGLIDDNGKPIEQ